jgi:parvulin-like peptidyl-prolyl isomerase
MRIKKIVLSLILMMAASAAFGQNSFVDKPVAIVKLPRTDVISQKKLAFNVDMYGQRAGRELSQLEKEKVLQTLVNQMLVFQAAERDNVTVDDRTVLQAAMRQVQMQTGQRMSEQQFKEFIKQNTGMDYDTYADTVKNQLILEKYVREKKRDFIRTAIVPDNEEIEIFYRDNEEKFINPEMIKFSHIFFATRGPGAKDKAEQKELANEVYRKIVSGQSSFKDMVREYSDDKGSVVRDGDIGNFIDRSEPNVAVFGKDFLNTLFDMETGSMSAVLESKQGYHIVILDQHHQKRFLNLDDPVTPVETTTVRQYIGNVLTRQKDQIAFEQAAEEVVKALSDEAEIQTFPENIK